MKKISKLINKKGFIYIAPLIVTILKILFFVPVTWEIMTADANMMSGYKTLFVIMSNNNRQLWGSSLYIIETNKYILESIIVFIIALLICIIIKRLCKKNETQ